MSMYRNFEGYSDPTAGEALSNIIKEERLKVARKRKAAAKTHGLSKDVEENKYGKDRPLPTTSKCHCSLRSEGLSEDTALAETEPEEY